MKTNQRELFAQLMTQHKGIIYKIVNSYCQSRDDRQDLAQEILTMLWLSFDKYNEEFKFSTWMYRIALNVAISAYRKDSRRIDKDLINNQALIQITDLDTEDKKDEEINQLYCFINQLDNVNKAIILLYLEDEPYQSIADSLGVSKTNVATRINRIKATLKKKFQPKV